MLQEIHVRNLALIEELHLELDAGFNVLTGETGAGKSIIIDALGLVLGERFSAEMIRTGADSLFVEAVFSNENRPDLDELLEESGIPLDPDNNLIIQREIGQNGKNRCRVNGHLVTVLILQKIGEYLLDIHGQHQHQSLLFPEKQLELLDQYCGIQCITLRHQLQEVYQHWHKVSSELQHLQKNQADTARNIDIFRFQSEEISNAKLVIGEDEELIKERQILASSEKLFEATTAAYQALYENNAGPAVIELLGEAERAMGQVAHIDPRLEPLMNLLREVVCQTEEVSRELRSYQEQVQFDPERLAALEDRLEEISQLKRKYGPTIAEVLLFAQKCSEELNALEHREEHSQQLEVEVETSRQELGRLAEQLSLERSAGAARLEQAIMGQLQDLNMAKTQFKIALIQTGDLGGVPYHGQTVEVSASGADRIDFLVAPNPGEAMKAMTKIASGGELSRIMLALKAILADLDRIPTMVFDEIDVGIGGRTAQAVAEKIQRIGLARQVICVTHLPQIASMAQRHFYIEKQVAGERTKVTVRTLALEQRVEELARMLGGAQVTVTTRQHAREMLEMAEQLRG
ncbi:MAG TPA: DNA repair protein RecN [Bacillota bacterium]|nr:DNA repair protein RecN [Bacillota bacterium]